MLVKVGLSANDLKIRTHKTASISSTGELVCDFRFATGSRSEKIPPGKSIVIKAAGESLLIQTPKGTFQANGISILPTGSHSFLCVSTLKRPRGSARLAPSYLGKISATPAVDGFRLILETDIENYLQGVLESEIPGSYHLEALKAQTVLARTYALRPHVNHETEGFNVCDSYLCCQYFAGLSQSIDQRQMEAIRQTQGEILSYDGKAILALFSANAGGHTENYENCFSDPVTNAFPPPPIPYLKGEAEGKLPSGFPDEQALRDLWSLKSPETADAWTPQFRWKAKFSAAALESHMHFVISEMQKDPQFGPFIHPPTSGHFGHIERFEAGQRGVSGVLLELLIHTSGGLWKIQKELGIRSAFANPDLKLNRLRSARIFFDHSTDKLGLLAELFVSGLGTGHGVGMQQTGAQGWAMRGKNYRQILNHYYAGTELSHLR